MCIHVAFAPAGRYASEVDKVSPPKRTSRRLPENFLTVVEAGRQVGLGRVASYLAARRGEIPVLQFGTTLIVPRDWLDEKMAQAKHQAAERRRRYAEQQQQEAEANPN